MLTSWTILEWNRLFILSFFMLNDHFQIIMSTSLAKTRFKVVLVHETQFYTLIVDKNCISVNQTRMYLCEDCYNITFIV